MRYSFQTAVSTLAAALLLTACGETKTVETTTTDAAGTGMSVADSAAMPTDSARMGKAGGVMVDGVAMTADKTIVENAAAAPSVSTLVAGVKAAELVDALSGTGPFTVFAPTNAAFDQLPKGALAGLLKPESKAKLQAVLKYHVIAGRLLAADLRDGQELTTLNGAKLKISVQGATVQVSNGTDAPVSVQIADVISKNGVTHVIGGVLLPPAGK